MTTTELDILTDNLAKTNATMFPTAEKLMYYNIGYGLLYALVIDEQEDNYESEPTAITTLASTGNYAFASRLHHINWVKVNYGSGFVPARPMTVLDLIAQYGSDYENEIAQWDVSYPIYWVEGDEINILPKPTAAQAGVGRLAYSAELLPADMTSGQSPNLPANFHYLLSEYAAYKYHENNGEDGLAKMRKANFTEGAKLMIQTAFPRERQAYIQSGPPDDDGSNY